MIVDSNKRTSVVSIRIPDKVRKELENDSMLNNITLNANVSKILNRYTDWFMHMENTNYVYTSKELLKELLKLIPQKKIEEITEKTCVGQFRNTIEFIHGNLNKTTFLKTVEDWLVSSNLPFRKMIIDDNTKFIINHNMGEKWSSYFDIVFCNLAVESGFEIKSKKIEADTISITVSNFE